jgi:hypothetical protein
MTFAFKLRRILVVMIPMSNKARELGDFGRAKRTLFGIPNTRRDSDVENKARELGADVPFKCIAAS